MDGVRRQYALKLKTKTTKITVTGANGHTRDFEYDNAIGDMDLNTIRSCIASRENQVGYCMLVNRTKDSSESTLFVIGAGDLTHFLVQYTVKRASNGVYYLIVPGSRMHATFHDLNTLIAHCITESAFVTKTTEFTTKELDGVHSYRYSHVQRRLFPNVVRAYMTAHKHLGYCLLVNTLNQNNKTLFVNGNGFIVQHSLYISHNSDTCVLTTNTKQTTFDRVEHAIVHCINEAFSLSRTKSDYGTIKALEYKTNALETKRARRETSAVETGDDMVRQLESLRVSSEAVCHDYPDKPSRQKMFVAQNEEDDIVGHLERIRLSPPPPVNRLIKPKGMWRPSVQKNDDGSVCYSAIRISQNPADVTQNNVRSSSYTAEKDIYSAPINRRIKQQGSFRLSPKQNHDDTVCYSAIRTSRNPLDVTCRHKQHVSVTQDYSTPHKIMPISSIYSTVGDDKANAVYAELHFTDNDD